MQIELIETERLRGERVNTHWQKWLEISSNPTVMATMGGIWDLEQAKQKMQRNMVNGSSSSELQISLWGEVESEKLLSTTKKKSNLVML